MDQMKQKIRQKLIANVIMEKCAAKEDLIFRDAWCTQERVIRFTTPFFRNMFPLKNDFGGRWDSGDTVMYEAENRLDSFRVNCVLDLSSDNPEGAPVRKKLLKAAGVVHAEALSEIILESWDLTDKDGDANKTFEFFDELLRTTIPRFEYRLRERLKDMQWEQETMTEGAAEKSTSNKYERNAKAREICLAYHGTACAVCGMDFGKVYGPDFAGKIEVHHIVPLSEIGETYVIDPVKDLIPVCPNCHTALHSKKDGVYTVEELRAKRAEHH